MSSNITAAIISAVIAALGVVVSMISVRKQISASNEQFDKQRKFDKNTDIRKKVADYLAEITKASDILNGFLQNRRHLESVKQGIAQITQTGGIGYFLIDDQRKEVKRLSSTLESLQEEWKLEIEEVKKDSQDLLLYFDILNSEKIEQLILYAPRNLPRYDWVFTNNSPEEGLKTIFESLCGDIDIQKNVDGIRIEMRKILN